MDFIVIIIALALLVGYYLFSTMQELKIKRAEKAVESGDLDTALSIFMNSLRKNPDDVESLWHLGNINEEKGQYPEAIGYYTKLIDIGKESNLFTLFELYRRVGLLYLKISRDQEALDFLLQAYQMIQSSRDVLENIAMTIFSQKCFHRALPFFEKGLQHMKNKADFLKSYGFCYLMLDKTQEAVSLLEEANQINSSDFQIKFILAYIYLKMGADQKCRELIEDLINSDNISLNSEQFYFAVKMLVLVYLRAKNFDTVRDLIQQMRNLNTNINRDDFKEEISMTYIFFRIWQGYYDVALEEIEKNIKVNVDIEKMDVENQRKVKENQSHVYELVSSLDRLKKEKDRVLYTGSKGSKSESEFSVVESRAKEAQKELGKIFDEWRDRFVKKEILWDFFGPRPKIKFDPSLILEKYSEENIKSLKKGNHKEDLSIEDESDYLKEDSEDICEKFMNADFAQFLATSLKLAENMGFKVINQAVKIDQMAYAEGQAIDMLCQEKFRRDSRVLFSVRRWKEPIGYLSIMGIMAAFKNLQANRLVLVSTSSLSVEASRAIEGVESINFYHCDEVSSFLM